MSTLHVNSYQERRAWADAYTAELNQIACRIMFSDPKLLSVYFKPPSQYEDRKLGIDMHVTMETARFSYRVREAKYKKYFMDEFTLRNSAGHGPTELEKVQSDNYADFLLYSVAHPSEYGVIDCAVMIDLKLLGIQLKAFPHLIEQATKGNGFLSFSYDSFPEDICVGMYGVKRKEDLCR